MSRVAVRVPPRNRLRREAPVQCFSYDEQAPMLRFALHTAIADVWERQSVEFEFARERTEA